MTKRILVLTLFALALPGITAFSQQEGPTPTQALVSFDSKTPLTATAKESLWGAETNVWANVYRNSPGTTCTIDLPCQCHAEVLPDRPEG